MNRMKKFFRYQIQKLRSLRQTLPTFYGKTQQLQFKLLAKKGTKIAKINPQIELPRNRYIFIERYLQMFFNSTSQNGRANGQNLAFVTGALGSGKTSLINQSLDEFKRKKKLASNKKYQKQIKFTTTSTPQTIQDEQRQIKVDNQFYLILKFDFKNNFMMKSQAFFHHIHSQVISEILRLCKQVKNIKNLTLLDSSLIKQIVLAQNSSQYIFVFVKDVIYAILNDCDQIRLSKDGLNKLQVLNQRIIQIRPELFFDKLDQESQDQNSKLSLYGQVIKLLSEQLNKSQLEASIILFMSIFKRIQYQNRPQIYKNSGYQTGIQTTTFLFSILNYICGFGNLNKKILKQYITKQENILQKQQNKINSKKALSKRSANETINSLNQKYQKYYIGRGNHIDVVLTFSHLQKLKCYKNPKFCQWFDNLLIQLQNATNLRTHFPVMIELSDSYQLSVLQKLGRMEIDNPTVVQIPGYLKTNLFRYGPSMVFNQYTLKRLRPALGRNQSTWNQAIQQLSKGVKIQDIVSGVAPFMNNKTFQIKFHNKINRMYLYPQNLPLIDQDTLKYHIIQYLNIFHRCKGFMKTLYMHTDTSIYYSKTIHQFQQQKLIYQAYYNSGVDLVDIRYLIQIRSYLDNLKFEQKIGFKLWKRFKSPYLYFYKQLRYRDDLQDQFYKRTLDGMQNQRSDYMVREYFGGLRDHKIIYYKDTLQVKYNV